MSVPGLLKLHLPTTEILLRLGVATLVGSLIGLNRELRHKAAGILTQALVIMGLADGNGSADVNAIIRGASDAQIQGLTTAASIWISATLGLACGVGLWMLALVVMLLALVVLRGGVWIEEWIHRNHPADPRDVGPRGTTPR